MSRLTAKTAIGLGKESNSERPASYESNKYTSPKQLPLGLGSKTSSCIIGGGICIESIDLLKFYQHKTRSLKIAVRVVDPERNPVSMAEVTLVTLSPGIQSHPWRSFSDGDGVVSFEILDTDHGEWYVWVTRVSHPFRSSESFYLLAFPLTTNV